MFFEMVNKNKELIHIKRGDIMGFVQPEDDIVGAIYSENEYREVIETLKTSMASSHEKKGENKVHAKRVSDDCVEVGVVVEEMKDVIDVKEERGDHQNSYSTLDVVKFIEDVFRESREKELRCGEELDSDTCSCDIKHSHAPPKFWTVGTDTLTVNGGEHPREVMAALDEGVLLHPCD